MNDFTMVVENILTINALLLYYLLTVVKFLVYYMFTLISQYATYHHPIHTDFITDNLKSNFNF